MSNFSLENLVSVVATNQAAFLLNSEKYSATDVIPDGRNINLDIANYSVFNVDMSLLTPIGGQTV